MTAKQITLLRRATRGLSIHAALHIDQRTIVSLLVPTNTRPVMLKIEDGLLRAINTDTIFDADIERRAKRQTNLSVGISKILAPSVRKLQRVS